MFLIIQRVSRASVKTSEKFESISKGFLIFLGVGKNDSEKDINLLANKIVGLRIFEDENGKMNLSIKDVNGEMLIISQFTLFADCKKGRRPSFMNSADPKMGEDYYNKFTDKIRENNINVRTGTFGAHMDVELVNDGPVTIILDSKNLNN